MSDNCRPLDYDATRCKGCGGINGLERWPAHAAGCNCLSRREARADREKLSALSLRGSLTPDELVALEGGDALRVAEGRRR
ncbi:MAG: hypothetical protein U0324_44040 [Polyangiales bacterium]